MKRILISLIIVLFIFILYSYSKITNKKDDLDTITLSEVTHSVFYAPFYVSIEKGYFKEEGININLVLTPGADKVASLYYQMMLILDYLVQKLLYIFIIIQVRNC